LRKNSTTVELYLEYDNKMPFSDFLNHIRQNDLDIVSLEFSKNFIVPDNYGAVTLTISGKTKDSHDIILNLFKNAPEIIFFMELY